MKISTPCADCPSCPLPSHIGSPGELVTVIGYPMGIAGMVAKSPTGHLRTPGLPPQRHQRRQRTRRALADSPLHHLRTSRRRSRRQTHLRRSHRPRRQRRPRLQRQRRSHRRQFRLHGRLHRRHARRLRRCPPPPPEGSPRAPLAQRLGKRSCEVAAQKFNQSRLGQRLFYLGRTAHLWRSFGNLFFVRAFFGNACRP